MLVAVILCLSVFWIVICFFDVLFKSCMLHPYIVLLERSGITIKPFQFHWYTTRWNRIIQKWGFMRPKFLRRWFGVGAFFTSLIPVPALCLLIATARSMLFSPDSSHLEQLTLKPVLPGVNLPQSDIPYYLITLLVSSMFHELGHALAAIREDVKVQGCGLFVFVIFPGAFVDLPMEQLAFLSSWRQLHIFCAGVWHNIILVIFAVLLLVANPILLAPFYYSGDGVSAVFIDQHSGIAGPAGLMKGDIVTSVNLCPVLDESSWKNCIIATSKDPQPGYCATKKFLQEENTAIQVDKDISSKMINCCDKEISSRLCFGYKEFEQQYACLPVRKMLQDSDLVCQTSENCGINKDGHKWECVTPYLENTTRLVQIHRRNGRKVLFVGSLSELYYSVKVTNWIPRFRFIPAQAAYVYETFLRYIVSFSGALAVLNVIPCPALDGQWITQALVEIVFGSLLFQNQKKFLCFILNLMGSALIISNIALGLWSLLM